MEFFSFMLSQILLLFRSCGSPEDVGRIADFSKSSPVPLFKVKQSIFFLDIVRGFDPRGGHWILFITDFLGFRQSQLILFE
jgi:hypothetical protein